VITITIRLRYDYDLTTTYRAHLLLIRRKQKMNMSVFRRSRIAVESQLWWYRVYIQLKASSLMRLDSPRRPYTRHTFNSINSFETNTKSNCNITVTQHCCHYTLQCNIFIKDTDTDLYYFLPGRVISCTPRCARNCETTDERRLRSAAYSASRQITSGHLCSQAMLQAIQSRFRYRQKVASPLGSMCILALTSRHLVSV